jgi:hypothetical protein
LKPGAAHQGAGVVEEDAASGRPVDRRDMRFSQVVAPARTRKASLQGGSSLDARLPPGQFLRIIRRARLKIKR